MLSVHPRCCGIQYRATVSEADVDKRYVNYEFKLQA